MLVDVWILGDIDSLNLDATYPNFEFVSWNLTFLQKHLQSTPNSYFFEEWVCSFWSRQNHFRPKWLSLFSQDQVGILLVAFRHFLKEAWLQIVNMRYVVYTEANLNKSLLDPFQFHSHFALNHVSNVLRQFSEEVHFGDCEDLNYWWCKNREGKGTVP